MVQRLWHRYSAYFHIIALLLTLGITWGVLSSTVNAQGERLDKLEVKHDTLADKVDDIKVDTAAIKQSVQDIKDALNIKHRDER
jgi:hypothetical protein